MDSMTVNKVLGAILIALLLVKVTQIIAEGPYHVEPPEEPAYAVAVPETDSGAGGAAEAEPEGPSLAMLLADASVDKGERVFRKCATCHKVEAGAASGIGPNLHNVIGAEVAHVDGFNYSDALAGYDGAWTYELMDAWLENPNAAFPGNKMAFAGLRKPEDRADVIAYLRAYTENPPPLPQPQAPAAEMEAGSPASP